jgi:2-oxoglutarate-Fe(II)-dependent oxygenase superfamily protein
MAPARRVQIWAMWRLGPDWSYERELAEAWRTARPFPHLVFEEFVPQTALPALMAVLEDEPVECYESDIFAFEASAPEPTTAEFRALRASFAAALAPPLSRITGKTVRRADMRAYAYRVGHYLLPHSDHQHGLERALAFAYYLPSPDPPDGGELELFRCPIERGEITVTESAQLIEPRANRLVVFDVSDVSLHQVREVLRGLRISLAGWFYA